VVRSLRFPQQDPIHSLSSPICATCPVYLILLDFITRTVLGEEYNHLAPRYAISSIPSMHVHLCKTVFEMVRLKICCLVSMVQMNVAVNNFFSHLVGTSVTLGLEAPLMSNTFMVCLSSSMKMAGKDHSVSASYNIISNSLAVIFLLSSAA